MALHPALFHPGLEHSPDRFRRCIEMAGDIFKTCLPTLLQVVPDLGENHAPSAFSCVDVSRWLQKRSAATTRAMVRPRPRIQAPELIGWRSNVAA